MGTLRGTLYGGWMRVAHALGWINTRVVLVVLFYLVFVPAGLLRRLIGHDPMRRRWDAAAPTYCQPREARPGTHMWHQY